MYPWAHWYFTNPLLLVKPWCQKLICVDVSRSMGPLFSKKIEMALRQHFRDLLLTSRFHDGSWGAAQLLEHEVCDTLPFYRRHLQGQNIESDARQSLTVEQSTGSFISGRLVEVVRGHGHHLCDVNELTTMFHPHLLELLVPQLLLQAFHRSHHIPSLFRLSIYDPWSRIWQNCLFTSRYIRRTCRFVGFKKDVAGLICTQFRNTRIHISEATRPQSLPKGRRCLLCENGHAMGDTLVRFLSGRATMVRHPWLSWFAWRLVSPTWQWNFPHPKFKRGPGRSGFSSLETWTCIIPNGYVILHTILQKELFCGTVASRTYWQRRFVDQHGANIC